MAFRSDIQHWKSSAQLYQHIKQHDPAICSWVQSIVIHHTYRPIPADWRGLQSMESLKRYYTQLGWDSGPHLFICADAPNPAYNGVFQLTALNEPGTHAGVCNSTSWGIEVVGDYDSKPWSLQTTHMVAQSVAYLMKWVNMAVASTTIKGHRDCNSPKSCPGSAINLDALRSIVQVYRYA
jgi:hypothetical protein